MHKLYKNDDNKIKKKKKTVAMIKIIKFKRQTRNYFFHPKI